MGSDLAGRVTPADIGSDLFLAWGKLFPAVKNPGLGVLLVYSLAKKLGSDFVGRTFLALGDKAQVLKCLDVHREDAFAMQPALDIAPDELPCVHNLIL